VRVILRRERVSKDDARVGHGPSSFEGLASRGHLRMTDQHDRRFETTSMIVRVVPKMEDIKAVLDCGGACHRAALCVDPLALARIDARRIRGVPERSRKKKGARQGRPSLCSMQQPDQTTICPLSSRSCRTCWLESVLPDVRSTFSSTTSMVGWNVPPPLWSTWMIVSEPSNSN